jgi:glycosyltransferase involved in cell wall biosynthesis
MDLIDLPGVVVANPGSIPEMSMMAVALSDAGLMGRYCTPFASTTRQTIPHVPRFAARLADQQLRRRRFPESFDMSRVEAISSALEACLVASGRLGTPTRLRYWLTRVRNERFDREVSRRLGRATTRFIGSYGASLWSFRRAKALGIQSYLDYPIAHHDFSARLLEQEGALTPSFASTLQFHRFSPSVRRRLDQEIEQADRVFVLSQFQKRTFVEVGIPEEKLISLPLGVDVDLFRPAALSKKDDVFRVLFVGQVTQRKGISYLLDAFRIADIPASELVLVGRIVGDAGPWSTYAHVRHRAPMPRWQLPTVYASADVFVLPSLIEGFPLTALEAMACGLPIIVSENTFGSDVVDDGINGFVVPIRDAGAIIDRLRYLHSHPAVRKQMGRAARARALEFSWLEFGRRFLNALGSVSSASSIAARS